MKACKESFLLNVQLLNIITQRRLKYCRWPFVTQIWPLHHKEDILHHHTRHWLYYTRNMNFWSAKNLPIKCRLSCYRNKKYDLPNTLVINPLKPELNPICYLLALLGAHHFLHVSRIRIKLLTFRRLMSYIYMEHPFLMFLDHTQRSSTVGRTPLDE